MRDLNTVVKMVANNGNIKFRVYQNDDFRSCSVRKLGLSNRAMNTFLRHGYDNVGDVIDNWNSIETLKGLGKKTVQEIKYAICSYQYSLFDTAGKKRYLEDIVNLNCL